MNYFIYGVPGVGKTYLAKKLGQQLNLSVIEGDNLKKQLGKSSLATCKAYRQFGELNQENAEKGLLFVRNALVIAVENKINALSDFILEAAFLDPARLIKLGKMILLTTIDEKQHKKQFLHHREKLFDLKNNEFKAARLLQQYLIKEAKHLGVEIINNDKVK